MGSANIPRMKSRADVEALPASDGRVRRGVRSREAIVAALMDLVGSGVLQPTVQQVADRAGVGIRSVFRHYSEMETLYRAMDAQIERDAGPLLLGGKREGSLEGRLGAMARRRAAFFERIAPFKRSGNLLRWRSHYLQQRHRNLCRILRTDLLEWLPELAAARSELLEAVDLAASFEAWDRLRSDQQLGVKAASAVLERTVGALLRDAGVLRPVKAAARRSG